MMFPPDSTTPSPYDARMGGSRALVVQARSAAIVSAEAGFEGDDDSLLTVADLCHMFEDAEEQSDDARQLAQRDRDYYDNKQLTDAQIAELRKRGQPEVVSNYIRVKINYLVGLEKQQRTLPRGLPRTPIHENDAHAVTDALKYVADDQGFHSIRSAVWRNMLIEGTGACAVRVEQKAPKPNAMMGSTALSPLQPEWNVKLVHYAWDRFFADPHSSRADYSDANYLGGIVWMDKADALAMYGADKEEILDATMASVSLSDTYDDTPKWSVWADKKRKRIRIVQIWVKRDEEWYFAEFTKGGILKEGVSPYLDEDGKTLCELVAQSAYVDRDNNRYGEVRAMVSPQDEMNKRRSKALHLLNTSQIVAEDGAVKDEDEARRQAAKPDGFIKLNPTMMDKFRFETRTDLAEGQMKLLQASQQDLSMMGPNAAMQGDQGKEASGRAILASQQGGMIEMGDLLDNLRHFDEAVFRQIWYRVRQFWTGPKWIRITDDERNVRFATLNGEINPQTGQPGPNVSDLDVDIIIDDAPDGVAPQMEQFQSLVEAKKMDVNNEIPFRVLLEAMPNLRNKDKLLAKLDEQAQARQQQPDPAQAALLAEQQLEAAKAEQEQQRLAQKQASDQQATFLKAQNDAALARFKAEQEAALKQWMANQEIALARRKADEEMQIKREIAEANTAIAVQSAERASRESVEA